MVVDNVFMRSDLLCIQSIHFLYQYLYQTHHLCESNTMLFLKMGTQGVLVQVNQFNCFIGLNKRAERPEQKGAWFKILLFNHKVTQMLSPIHFSKSLCGEVQDSAVLFVKFTVWFSLNRPTQYTLETSWQTTCQSALNPSYHHLCTAACQSIPDTHKHTQRTRSYTHANCKWA